MNLQEIQADYLILEQELNANNEGFTKPIQRLKTAQTIISKALKIIRSAILEKKFQNIKEEIIFFKEILPKFLSLLYFAKTLRDMETHKPVCSDKDLIIYWEKQLDDLKCFFKNHEEFYIYVRSENTDSDHVYFVRSEIDTLESHCSFHNTIDNRVSTEHSNLVAKIISNDKICEYIKSELSFLNNPIQIPIQEIRASTGNSKLIWTGSKAALAEVLFGLIGLNVFNDGNASNKQVFEEFGLLLHIDLEQHPRMLVDIKGRKTEKPRFVNKIQAVINNLE